MKKILLIGLLSILLFSGNDGDCKQTIPSPYPENIKADTCVAKEVYIKFPSSSSESMWILKVKDHTFIKSSNTLIHAAFCVCLEQGKWKRDGYTRFIKGDMEQLMNLKKFSRYAKSNFAVTIVQPGLSKAKVTTGITQLLGCTENYLIKTTNAPFKVICSR